MINQGMVTKLKTWRMIFAESIAAMTGGLVSSPSTARFAPPIFWAALSAVFLCLLPSALLAATRTWTGDGANNLASTPANWGGTAPGANDAIELNATSSKNMTWNMTNMTVASWSQVGYLGTVTVATVYDTAGFTNLNIIGNCIISNGVWTHAANAGTEVNRLSAMIGGNLIVGFNAAIDVTEKGFSKGTGPGFRGLTGSYGGCGNSAGPCYGSIVTPTNLGSGGSYNPGGGAIQLAVAGEIRNDGLICANGGGAGPGNDRSGSGGSIWLTSGTLIGSGAIRDNGGYYNAGGGGRVSLVVTNIDANFSNFTGAISAYGGVGGAVNGGAGTVYLRTAGQELFEGVMIVDNNSFNGNATEINSNVTDAVVGHLLIRNRANLLLCTNQILTLSGTWSNGASFVSQMGSKVIFAGPPASTSTVYGTNTFMVLICTNAGGKTILFEAGKTNAVAALGLLKLNGSATATNLMLRSTIDGAKWKLNVNGSAGQSIQCVDVKDSDALSGAAVGAFNSIDSGGNSNWVFALPGQMNIWTGTDNTAWNLGRNWSLGHAPLVEDMVRIPSGCARYPVLDTAKIISGGFEIQNGASLWLGGFNLTVTTNAVVAGALTASNTETITFMADVNFTGCSFTPAFSTVVIGGTGGQAINLWNQFFHNINVTNNAGPISFPSGFSAAELRCEATGGLCSIVFQPGANYILRSLVLLGAPDTTNIKLSSSSTGQKWDLNVTGCASVIGVDVKDCDAIGGKPINAILSKDSGNNVNWFFAENWSTWIGNNGSSFHVAENWLPPGVPGPTSRVLIKGPNAVSITSAVTVLELVVASGAGTASATVNAPLTVVENIVVLNNGVLALNRPCVVSNDVDVLAGGILTHSGPQDPDTSKLNMTVYGNFVVDEDGAVDVTAKGYASNVGIGYYGSHGGRGTIGPGSCYGSILAPTNLGSGGNGDPGGGAIILNVMGAIGNAGLISADGWASSRSGAGGSIFLTSGTLNGNGIIRANGGSINPGGGGRVSLVVRNEGADFSLYTGSVLAQGGGSGSGAGTVYRECAADLPGRGTVQVFNNGTGNTDVPPSPPCVTNEVEFTSFFITNSARMHLTNDYMLGDIHLQSANSWLDLGFNTLTVRSREHLLGPGVVTNRGFIIWWPDIPKGVVFSTW